MKILAGGIYHESNSFSNVPTDIDAFRSVLLLEGQEVIDKLRGTTSEMAGFLVGADRLTFDIVPALWAWGVATGPVRVETLEYLLDIVRRRFEKEGSVDGILFALHGALVAEQALDGDGYILSWLRALAGKIPIVVTVDLHANISERMVEMADAIVGYDTYPHTDQVERGPTGTVSMPFPDSARLPTQNVILQNKIRALCYRTEGGCFCSVGACIIAVLTERTK